MQLSKSEELLMTHLWSLEEAFMKDLIECYEDPKPATTTIATLLKRMQTKGFVTFTAEGRARKYKPAVMKSDYVSGQFKGFVSNFFENSASQFASFFTNSTDMSKEELQALRDMIDNQIAKK
ncbi:MAG: BlaI/MecI/CopY family transcriptional regulator [Saprospiraceae bacterium]|nr:BlaI/MecI/CopY family transcriptional regulator [Saprospiraceae bacterium]